MMNIKTFIVFLLTSLCSVAALAMPSVGEVENAISAGDYPKARSLLGEVLKKEPASLVANKYMLEIIKLEYARTLKPSMEYKLYENRIQLIEKSIDLKKQAAKLKAIAEKEAVEKAERRQLFNRVVKWFIGICVFFCAIAVFFLVILPRIKQAKIKKEKQKELLVWKGQAYADMIDINSVISSQKSAGGNYHSLDEEQKGDIDAIEADNLDAIGCLEVDNFERDLIVRHIRNGKNYLYRLGWME